MATDLTSRMVYLLGELRREMNGAVADSMRYYGTRYGLNYGVSLPTIRTIASKEPANNDLALYLLKQDVRELRLAALHIAEPTHFDESKELWQKGITTSEIAEEMAFALLSHISNFEDLYKEWSTADDELIVYAVLMAAARQVCCIKAHITTLPDIISRHSDSRLVAQGIIAILSSALAKNLKEEVQAVLHTLPDCKAQEYISDEMSWRME